MIRIAEKKAARPRIIFLRRGKFGEVTVLAAGRRRELWIADDWQGTWSPGRIARGWYWPLMADELGRQAKKICAASRCEPELLALGLGAATVPRLLRQRGFTGTIRVIERDAAVIAALSEAFPPVAGLQIIRADAAQFARAGRETFDLIAEDVFAAATQMKFSRRAGLDEQYFRALWKKLRAGGALVVNVFNGPQFAADRNRLRVLLKSFAPIRVRIALRGDNAVWTLVKPFAAPSAPGGRRKIHSAVRVPRGPARPRLKTSRTTRRPSR